jgi:hypothetical protein
MGNGCMDPRFLDLGTRCRWVVSFTPLPLYPLGKNPRYLLNRKPLVNGYNKYCKPVWSDGHSSWLQNGDILCFLWGTNRIYICYGRKKVDRLCGLVVRVPGYLKKNSGSGLETRLYGRRDPSSWPRGTLYPQNVELTSPTIGGRSVDIVRSWTEATGYVCLFVFLWNTKFYIVTYLYKH